MHLRIDSGRTTPARPSARAPGSRAAPIASAPAAHASGNRGSHQSSATRAAQQVPTASSSSAPQNRTRSPVSSARPLCPSHGPSRAAASHLHSEPRHALHTAHTRPPETSTAPAQRLLTCAHKAALRTGLAHCVTLIWPLSPGACAFSRPRCHLQSAFTHLLHHPDRVTTGMPTSCFCIEIGTDGQILLPRQLGSTFGRPTRFHWLHRFQMLFAHGTYRTNTLVPRKCAWLHQELRAFQTRSASRGHGPIVPCFLRCGPSLMMHGTSTLISGPI